MPPRQDRRCSRQRRSPCRPLSRRPEQIEYRRVEAVDRPKTGKPNSWDEIAEHSPAAGCGTFAIALRPPGSLRRENGRVGDAPAEYASILPSQLKLEGAR